MVVYVILIANRMAAYCLIGCSRLVSNNAVKWVQMSD